MAQCVAVGSRSAAAPRSDVRGLFGGGHFDGKMFHVIFGGWRGAQSWLMGLQPEARSSTIAHHFHQRSY